ncbi:MAG: hypothetical protein K5931_07370, partial [Lachnospiraceae bacterium]|nr:hypothetical protein [Lachnospiraceae bacterium]
MIKRIKEDNLIFAFMINIMALISSLIFFRPFFEENDDAFIAMIAEGAFGKRDFHVIYPNALYGKLLSLLSALFPALRWHSIIQYILVFGALTAISFLIFEYSKKRGLGILFILASFYELYVSLQYSKTALAASTAGFALILDEVLRAFDKGRRLDLKRLIPASLLLFFGALLRDSSFFLAGIFALSALLTGAFSRLLKREGRERMGLLTVNCLKAFLPIILLVFACIFYNKGLYDSDSEWKSFISYNKSRMELLDYRYDLMDFNGNEKLLREEGISENDALLYLTWQFGDDKVIPKEKMSGLVKKGEKRPFDISLLKAFAFNIYKDIFNITPLLVFTLMLIVLSFAEGFRRGKGGRLLLFETALFLCIYFMLLFYFQYSG